MIRRNDVQTIVKGDKRIVNGWVMYDWANSVYQLTIASAIFPIYYNTVTRTGDDFSVSFFGAKVINTVLYSWAIAAAYLLVALFSPLFSSMADYSGRRKGFMRAFTLIGAVACGLLYFFDRNHIELGVIAFTLGTIGYGGSIVFYNSFLPVIAEPEDQDRISARGYSMGYLGGVVLLLFNLLMIMKPGLFGIEADSSLPARISFLSVCVWWIGFSQITFSRLPRYTFRKRITRESVWTNGYNELRAVFSQIKKSYKLSMYLAGFFFLMMGVLTTMFMAATYGEKQVGLKEDVLIPTVLAIQLVGMLGAWMFARISEKLGNLRALMISTIAWTFICIGAYFITNALGFLTAAFFIGIVMGGSQSLARSTYSKMLPADTTDHTSFFSFYDVMEKLATVAGTFSFGAIEALTGSMRFSVLAITIFFVLSLVFMLPLYWRTRKENF
ncbi:MAG TPA: MFS transporter [Prolixibacteraceae bacterium]|nr:MFS transporter [Prolixibacteraceae bacterium]HPR84864.1 MFS transporter [Prolixibacteraceae bacterium]